MLRLELLIKWNLACGPAVDIVTRMLSSQQGVGETKCPLCQVFAFLLIVELRVEATQGGVALGQVDQKMNCDRAGWPGRVGLLNSCIQCSTISANVATTTCWC